MSVYWVSEDGKKEFETFESFLRRCVTEKQVTHHQLIVSLVEGGDTQFMIKPRTGSKETLEFKVTNNNLYPADPAFENDESGSLLFLVHHDRKVFKADATSRYLNLLETLHKAVKDNDESAIKEGIKALEEWEEEWT